MVREIARLRRELEALKKRQRRRIKTFEKSVPSTGKKRRERTKPIVVVKTKKRRRQHPDQVGVDAVVAEYVRIWLKAEFERVADEIGGAYSTHLYKDSAEVTALVTQSASIGALADDVRYLSRVFAPAKRGAYYGETYFQAKAVFLTGKQPSNMTKGGSSLGRSRVGPNGNFYDTAKSYWHHGDVDKCLLTLQYMIQQVLMKTPYKLEEMSVQAYWSPIGRRPER